MSYLGITIDAVPSKIRFTKKRQIEDIFIPDWLNIYNKIILFDLRYGLQHITLRTFYCNILVRFTKKLFISNEFRGILNYDVDNEYQK